MIIPGFGFGALGYSHTSSSNSSENSLEKDLKAHQKYVLFNMKDENEVIKRLTQAYNQMFEENPTDLKFNKDGELEGSFKEGASENKFTDKTVKIEEFKQDAILKVQLYEGDGHGYLQPISENALLIKYLHKGLEPKQ
jgi:hypothetical protein